MGRKWLTTHSSYAAVDRPRWYLSIAETYGLAGQNGNPADRAEMGGPPTVAGLRGALHGVLGLSDGCGDPVCVRPGVPGFEADQHGPGAGRQEQGRRSDYRLQRVAACHY